MVTGKAIAIIFAGGTGSRMNGGNGIPKQFRSIQGRPVLVRTLDHFEQHAAVDRVYVSCLATYLEHTRELVREFGLTKVAAVTPGGPTAQHSIFNGLRLAVDDGVPGEAVTLIHDGVRPVINSALIDANIWCAEQYGSAVTAIPCFETVAMSLDGAHTVESVTRRELMHVLQAPQTFRLDEVHRANARALEEGLLGTFVDQAQLMNHYGKRLRMVAGLRGNVKLTTEFDLLQFRLMVEASALPV